MLPGGFSAGDEPDGSGKFIATVLRNPMISDAVMDLLKNRDGLILGICNGFQALIKTGLVPYGEIRPPEAGTPTLTFNDIGRHIACYATTRIASTMSPWLANCEVGELHNIAFSHGEGKFYASNEQIQQLAANGQIASQYTDLAGTPSMDISSNPNGSLYAIEGITSPCGRVLGKMGHTERRGENIAKNIPGNKHQPLFKAGVSYFK
jgi:phosphoribosylformylglycinamidine synthase